MILFNKKFFIAIIFFTLSSSYVFSARVYMEGGNNASSNRNPMSVQVFIDAEGDKLSSVSGSFSFPADLFDVKTISTENSVVPVWITSPSVSLDKNYDLRTHIYFSGIIPGGFSGVRSPYYDGLRPGVLFTILLIPKNSGKGTFLLDNIEAHAFDPKGTLLKSTGDIQPITVPNLIKETPLYNKNYKEIIDNNLTILVNKNNFIDNNAWYLYVHEDGSVRSIDHIEVSESSEYDPYQINDFNWKTITIPYILFNQSRNVYLHIKVFFTDDTYTIKTVSPVENLPAYSYLSRIIIIISIVALSLYFYATKKIKRNFPKKN